MTEAPPCIERQQPAGSGSQDDDDAEGVRVLVRGAWTTPWMRQGPLLRASRFDAK